MDTFRWFDGSTDAADPPHAWLDSVRDSYDADPRFRQSSDLGTPFQGDSCRVVNAQVADTNKISRLF